MSDQPTPSSLERARALLANGDHVWLDKDATFEDAVIELAGWLDSARQEGREGWRNFKKDPPLKEHGREILIACDCPHMMAVVEWLSADEVLYEDFTSGWYISDGHNDPIWFRANPYITHWMELPSPPATAIRSLPPHEGKKG